MQIGEFVQDVARGAGAIQKAKYQKIKTWREKSGRGDIVTEVDEECERYILGRINAEYPGAAFLSEERGAGGSTEDDLVWVIDPLDGTRNYAIGIPFFCVSIGLARRGRPEMGAIYDPIHDEMYFAARGLGAFLNGDPIHVSPDESMEDGIVSVSWVKRKVDRTQFVRYVDLLSNETSYFRRFGSAALVMAYVATGKFSAYMQGGLCPWDVAAGVVLIEEAGGTVTDFEGRPIDVRTPDIELVAANPRIHGKMLHDVIGKGRQK